jgi:hypothetical protein
VRWSCARLFTRGTRCLRCSPSRTMRMLRPKERTRASVVATSQRGGQTRQWRSSALFRRR